MTNTGAVNGGVVAGAPSDNTTMSDVLRHYDRAGFTSSWTITADSQLRCETCHREMAPSSVGMHSLRRVEGASDPADTAAVLALTCIYCGARGTLVTMYGPLASAEESDVVTALRDRRADDLSTPDAPPGETANHEATSQPPRIGDRAPDFAAASSTGHVLDLDAFLGKVRIAMTFCGSLHDHLTDVVDEQLSWFGAHRVQVLLVVRDDADAVEEARSSGRLQVPVLADPNGDLETRFLAGDHDRPATLLIGTNGEVFSHIEGGSAEAHVSRVREAVELHLA